MWINRFKQKIKQLGLRYEDVAKSMGMTINGFNSAMKNATFSYRNMIKAADTYGFSLDELRYEETNGKVEEAVEKYKTLEKKHSFPYEKTIPLSIYEDVKLNYENRITDLKGQLDFLQYLLEKQGSNQKQGSSQDTKAS